jgi:hypothetical protein
MNLPAFVASLRQRGVALRLVAGRVRAEAAKGILTDADRGALSDHRAQVFELLQNEAEGARLRTLYAGLTPHEQGRFADELAAGDSGALLVNLLMQTPTVGSA